MAALTVTVPSEAGTAISFVAAGAGGDTATWYSDLVLHVKNGDASPHTVTIDVPGACEFGVVNAAHDHSVTVAAGAEKQIRIGSSKFKQSNGNVNISYDGVTSVTVAAFRR